MADPRSCLHQYFFNGSQIGYSINVAEFEAPHAGIAFRSRMDRPFIPIWPLVNPVTGIFEPDTVANFQASQTNKELMYTFAKDVLQASYNFMNGVPGNVQYESGDYGNYLALKIGDNPYNQKRFKQIHTMSYVFGNALNPATTQEELNSKIDAFISMVKNQADPRYFLAPGVYNFGALSFTAVDNAAYKVISPSFTGFMTLELESIV